MSLEAVEAQLNQLKTTYNQEAGKLALLETQRAEKQMQFQRTTKDIEAWQQVQLFLTEISEYSRQQLKLRIEETVTAALQAVFMNDRIRFEITIRTLDGKPAADWTVVNSFDDVTVSASPEDSKGGGVTDVVSLALRLALLELARPKPQGPIILDEPGKMISREYLPNVAEFLKQYLQKTGRQGIIITHAEALAEVADVSYRVSQTNGISEVTRV
jgi:DNA repair exonuclease SbcCD ATPase subunit